jgi:hypothetical protein
MIWSEWFKRRQEARDRKFNASLERFIATWVSGTSTIEAKRQLAITASASTVNMDGASWRNYRFGDRTWQADAWRLYDITGQLRFVANWIGNSVSRCRMYVANVDVDGNPIGEVEDENISRLAAGPLGVGDARAEALRLLGIDLFVPGEAFIVAQSGGGQDGGDIWWVVTARQIKRSGNKITIERSPLHGGGTMEYRDGIDMITRCWTPHPHDTSEPDSPTRSAIPDLRELEALRKRCFAELDSRLSGAGILALPDSLELPRAQDDPSGTNGFFAYLMRAMSRSLSDRSSAEAMVPIMVTGPGDDIERIKHITFWSDLSEQISSMRGDALRSLAQSLDIPPEVLLGLGSTNHWSAWAISDEAVQTQIKPILSRIGAALTAAYLRPALELLDLDPNLYAFAFDTAPLTTRPNRTADAVTFYDRMLLSGESARNSGAWTDADAPDNTEIMRRLTEQLFAANPDAVLSDPGLREILGIPGSARVIEATPTTTPSDVPAPIVDEQSPPGQPTQSDGQPTSDGSPITAASCIARYAVRRALSLAGTRLVPHGKRANVDRHKLHMTVASVAQKDVERLLSGEWRKEFDGIGEVLGISDDDFIRFVEGHCAVLLTQRLAYDDHDVDAAFARQHTMLRGAR